MSILKLTLPFIVVLAFFHMPFAYSQVDPDVPTDRIQWMSWEEALLKVQDEPRKIVLDIFAEWSEMCRHMESTTFQHPELVRYINRNFYPVRLDAQSKGDLIYRDKTYSYVQRGKTGYHELVAEFMRGQMSFPAVVFLDEQLELIQSFVGYKTPIQFEKISAYFGSDLYKQTPWSTFQRTYTPCITE